MSTGKATTFVPPLAEEADPIGISCPIPRFTPRAAAGAKRAQAKWRADRLLAPELFEQELAVLVHQLETIEHFGTPHPTPRRPWLKRALLGRTEFHVYFEAVDRLKEIRVLVLWHARCGREPNL